MLVLLDLAKNACFRGVLKYFPRAVFNLSFCDSTFLCLHLDKALKCNLVLFEAGSEGISQGLAHNTVNRVPRKRQWMDLDGCT